MSSSFNLSLTFPSLADVEHSDMIDLVDSNEDLKMFAYKYNQCRNDSEPLVKQTRGLVFAGNDLIAPAFPYNAEYTVKNFPEFDPNESIAFPAVEGCVIRLFHHNGQQYVTTHRKLNAHESKWGSSKSFGSVFDEQLAKYPRFQPNPEYVYRWKIVSCVVRIPRVCIFSDIFIKPRFILFARMKAVFR